MAKAYIEIDWAGDGHQPWTLEEYERFMVGTGEWPSDEIEKQGVPVYLPSGCYFIPEQYTHPNEDGAVV